MAKLHNNSANVLKNNELYYLTRRILLYVNYISLKLLLERECVSEVTCKPKPLNFLQLSNFHEISFKRRVTTSEENETKSLAVSLDDGQAEFQAEVEPVSGPGSGSRHSRLPAGSGTSAGCA